MSEKDNWDDDILWKIFMDERNKDKKLVSSVIEDEYVRKGKEYRPVISFIKNKMKIVGFMEYDYGYLKMCSISDKQTIEPYEIKIEKNNKYSNLNGAPLPRNDSLVDCHQIFLIEENCLDKLIDKKNPKFVFAEKIYEKNLNSNNNEGIKEMNNILNGVKECIMQNPPYLSIINVSKDENNKSKFESLYLHSKILEKEINNMNKYYEKINSNKHEDINNYKHLLSNKNDAKWKLCMGFCCNFLIEYFPKDVPNFFKLQKMSMKNYFNENPTFKDAYFKKLNSNNKINNVDKNIKNQIKETPMKKGIERERKK